MTEVDFKKLKFNPFKLLGKEWMLLSAGNEQDGCLALFLLQATCKLVHSSTNSNKIFIVTNKYLFYFTNIHRM